MFPNPKLLLVFGKMAKNYGPLIMNRNNPDLLTQHLGNAMKKQKNILSDAKKGAVMTAYDVAPVAIEVRVLTYAVAKSLEIETKGKPDIAIIEEIVAKSQARNGGRYAKDVKETLEWTRKLFALPEIQDVLSMEMTAIERPKSPGDVLKFFQQAASRVQDESTRIAQFLKRAKDLPSDDKKPEPPKAPGT